MPQITVFLLMPGGGRTSITVPDDSPANMLMPAIASTLDLPSVNADGNILIYRLKREKNNAVLNDNDTLASIGTESQEVFSALPMQLTQVNLKSSTDTLNKSPKVEDEFSAPVTIPSRESLTIGLVRSDLVYQLEEYRSDQRRWETLTTILVGAALGIVVNWVTGEPIVITKASVVILITFIGLSFAIWLIARDFSRRAMNLKQKIQPNSSNQMLHKE